MKIIPKIKQIPTLIQNKNIFVLYLVTFFSALYFYHPIGTLYFQERGLSLLAINSLWGVIVFIMAFAEIPTGIIADKIGRKKSIIFALIFQLLGEIIFVFADQYWMFVIVSIIGGIGFAFSSGAFEAMLYDSFPKQKTEEFVQKIRGLQNAFKQTAVLVGALLGGYFASGLDLESYIFVITLTIFAVGISVLCALFLVEPKVKYVEEKIHPIQLFKNSFKILVANSYLLKIVFLSIFSIAFIDYLLTFYQPYLVKTGLSGFWLGAALSVASIGGILVSKYAYMLEKIIPTKTAVFIAIITPGILYLLMAQILHPVWSLVLFVLAYATIQFREPVFMEKINSQIPSQYRATTLSIISMVTGIYIAGIGLVFGWLGDIDLNYAFYAMGGILIVTALISLFVKTKK